MLGALTAWMYRRSGLPVRTGMQRLVTARDDGTLAKLSWLDSRRPRAQCRPWQPPCPDTGRRPPSSRSGSTGDMSGGVRLRSTRTVNDFADGSRQLAEGVQLAPSGEEDGLGEASYWQQGHRDHAGDGGVLYSRSCCRGRQSIGTRLNAELKSRRPDGQLTGI